MHIYLLLINLVKFATFTIFDQKYSKNATLKVKSVSEKTTLKIEHPYSTNLLAAEFPVTDAGLFSGFVMEWQKTTLSYLI